MLEVTGAVVDDALIAGWQMRVARARERLRWDMPGVLVRRHAHGASFALAAPCDELLVATEVNEWALCATLLANDPHHWRELEDALIAATLEEATDPEAVSPPVLAEDAALARLERLAAAAARPALLALLAAARTRSLPHILGDTTLTLGAGVGGRDFVLAGLPAPADVRWQELRDIPTAVVTGSNGKTTTVRVLAACARAHGWHCAYNCTDGVFLDSEALESGDYSGPANNARRRRSWKPRAAESCAAGSLSHRRRWRS